MFETLKPPYRMPCDQINGPTKIFMGTEFNHKKNNETASIYTNVTQVSNPTGSGTVDPYERWTTTGGGAACEVHFCTGSVPCVPWERPYIDNVFSASLDASGSHVTESFAACHKTGFKNVMAKKLQQGYRAFNDLESTNSPDTVVGCGTDPISNVSYRSYQATPSRTKYLTISISSDWTHTDYDDSGNDLSEAVGVTQTINSGSGLPLYSGFSSTGGNLHAIGNVGIALQGFSSIVSGMCTGVIPAFGLSTRTWSGGTIDLTHDTFGYSIDKEVYDIAAGTFSRDINSRDSSGFVFNTFHEEYSVSATSLSYTSTESTWDSPTVSGSTSTLAQTDVVNVSATLSNPYTDSNVYSEIKNMLATWDLANDIQYPWRADSKSNIAPLVARDEQVNNNFTTNFSVKDFGNPIANHDGTTFPDIGWVGTCGLAVSQDTSTGTTTIAMEFASVEPGADYDGDISNPFSQYSGSLTFSVIGGRFPLGVTFNSTTGHYSGTTTDYEHCGITIEISCGVPAFTGKLYGDPLPAGYHYSFNFPYNDIKGCCQRNEEEGIVSWVWYQQGWGMNVSTFNDKAGTQLPLNCTNWTNYWESVNKPDGAFLFFADPRQDYFANGCISSFGISGTADGNYLVGCKYAVIMDDWPSQNFQRPAGKDKFIFDETANHVFQISGSCEDGITSISGSGEGSTWGLLDLINHNPVPDDTDFSGIWGGPGVDGFYNVSYAGGVLTLGTKIYDVPSDWTSASEDEDFCFGKLRFPDVASLLGREAATSLATGSQTLLTWVTPQTCFGLNTSSYQESVDFYDTKMTLLSSSIVVTRIDDSSFLSPLSSSFLKDGHIYYVTIHGSSGSWYMNDSTPKGDYLMLEWLSDFRSQHEAGRISGSIFDCGGSQVSFPSTNKGGGDVNNLFAAFSQSASCLPVSTCAPKVICISPSGEVFPNGHTFPFPEDFVMDETYGMKWWKWPQTVMSDLLWQQPHRRACIGNCAPWKNDNFGCNGDVVTPCPSDPDYTGEEPAPEYFFASAPQVEARLSVPCNYGNNQNECAPDVPDDVQIGWLSPIFYSSGSIALPPLPAGVSQGGGIPNSTNLAAQMHAQICAAMTGGCRFSYSTAGCGI